MRKTVYQSKSGADIGVNTTTQMKVMIFAAGLVDAKHVDLSQGFKELIGELKAYGFKNKDIQFIHDYVEKNKSGQSHSELFQGMKNAFIPKELLETIASPNNSRTKILASFLRNEMQTILDDDDLTRRKTNKDGIRKIVGMILNSPEKNQMLIYMQANLGQEKFLDFMSICMDSKSLKKLHGKYGEVVRFHQLKNDRNLYSALSDEIRKGSRVSELFEKDFNNSRFDSERPDTKDKKGFLENLMIAPRMMANLVTTRLFDTGPTKWGKEASEKAKKIIDDIPKETREKMRPEVIQEMSENYQKKYISQKKREAVFEDKENTKRIYKALYGQYVSKDNQAAFQSEYDKNPIGAMKYIRADRRFNPFMYARVFVDGLAQEYMVAVDKLSPGQSQQASTAGAKVAKGIITAFRTVLALPLRVLADPVGVGQSIGTSIKKVTTPIGARFRKWQEDRGKSSAEKFQKKATDTLAQLKEIFKSGDKFRHMNEKALNSLNSFMSENMQSLLKSGLINTSNLSKQTDNSDISDLIKKVANVASGQTEKFTRSELSVLFKHMEKRAGSIETDFANGQFSELGRIKTILENASTTGVKKIFEEVSTVPHLDLNSLNGNNSAQNIEAALDSARSPGSSDSFSSSDIQSPHDDTSSISSPRSSRDDEPSPKENLSSMSSMASILHTLKTHPVKASPERSDDLSSVMTTSDSHGKEPQDDEHLSESEASAVGASPESEASAVDDSLESEASAEDDEEGSGNYP